MVLRFHRCFIAFKVQSNSTGTTYGINFRIWDKKIWLKIKKLKRKRKLSQDTKI